MTIRSDSRPDSLGRKALRSTVWVPQLLVAAIFIGAGSAKLAMPYAEVVHTFGAIPQPLLIVASTLEVIGGLGVLLPSLTRIAPSLTVWAALGCALLQAGAALFHLLQGDTTELPLNLALIALPLAVAWLRWRVALIRPRTKNRPI